MVAPASSSELVEQQRLDVDVPLNRDGSWRERRLFPYDSAEFSVVLDVADGVLEVFRVSGAVTFCCYVLALWQDWIWWGKSTRSTVTNSLDGIIYALITGATFGWLWPH